MMYVLNDRVIVLPQSEAVVTQLLFGLGLIPNNRDTLRLLQEIKAQVFPPGSDAEEWARMEHALKGNLREYVRWIREKYSLPAKGPKATPRKTLLGYQDTDGNRTLWVSRVLPDGTFDYRENRAVAHVFPSRNAAHKAVRSRMRALRDRLAGVPGRDIDREIGKYTDFFTEPLFDAPGAA